MPDKSPTSLIDQQSLEKRVQDLLEQMTLAEKIGQMNQVNSDGPSVC